MSDSFDDFRLPVVETVRQVLGFLMETRRDLVLIAGMPVAALTIYKTVLAGFIDLRDPGTFTLGDVLLTGVPVILVYMMFVVAWQRRFLVSSATATVWSAFRWDRRRTRMLFRSLSIILTAVAGVAIPVVVLIMIVVIVNLAAATNPETPPLTTEGVSIVVGGVSALLLSLVLARLSLWLPAGAMDAPFGLLELWRLGQRNSWRLLGIVLAPQLPGWFLWAIWSGIGAALPAESLAIDFLRNLGHFSLAYLILAGGLAGLSAAYDRLLSRLANDPFYSGGMPQ